MACGILARLWTFCYIIGQCTSLTFDIQRQNKDIVPNDFTITNGFWTKTRCRNSCSQFNTDSQSGLCRCTCKYTHSTFRMGATAKESSCIKNECIRKDSGCQIYFENFGHATNEVPVLPSTTLGLKIKSPSRHLKCRLSGNAQYWDKGKWTTAQESDLFEISGQSLKWKYNAVVSSYTGRLMRQYMTKCKGSNKNSCIVFKAGGTLKYDIAMPTTATVTSSTTHSTPTRSTPTQATSQRKTSPHPSTMSTSSSTLAPVVTTSGIPVITDNAVTDEPATLAPTTESTEKTSTTTEGPSAGDKGGRGGDDDGDGNTLMVAAIVSVAAIICVVIICVFVWFVIKRRQTSRDDKAYSSDMTVITNATGTNNTLSGSAVYCDPTEQHYSHFPKQLPRFGNPLYAKAIIEGSRAIGKEVPLAHNNSASHRAANSYKGNNQYDNQGRVDDEDYANPTYQDILPVKQVNNKSSTDDSTYDNYYVELEKPIYEELPDKSVRESMYQPLIRDGQLIQGEETEIPEYLAITNEDPSSHDNQQTIPEYVTIIPDKPGQSQPRALKEPKKTGLSQPKGDGSKSTVQAPVNKGPQSDAENEYLTPIDGAASVKR